MINVSAMANIVGAYKTMLKMISENAAPETKILSINGSSITGNEDLFQALSAYLDNSPYLQGNSHRIHEVVSLSSSTFLLIGFLAGWYLTKLHSLLFSAVNCSKAFCRPCAFRMAV